ncbi:MAG: ATP-binding cassette domain-containing protein [Gemmataceae bacterium]|nr:ATP-binding cassette domain-containing protein [Gemmataceae bacterium]
MPSWLPNPLPTYRRFRRMFGYFIKSKDFPKSAALFGILFSVLIITAYVNGINNRIGGDITTAIDHKQPDAYTILAFQYIGFFFLLTLLGTSARFLEERLSLLLRRGLTEDLIQNYLNNRSYLKLRGRPEIDNPDQRITEDVKTLTTNAVSFVIVVTRSSLNFFVFWMVLWRITPSLNWAAAIYAAVGSIMTVLIGRKLVGLNIDQLHKEADLRYELVRTRDHAEAIALQHDECRQCPRLLSRMGIVVENMRKIILRTAGLTIFTTAYSYMIIVVPIMIVAPLVMRGDKAIGAITQAADAFRFVVDAFSVFITEFPRLTLLTAVLARLGELTGAIRAKEPENGLKLIENGDVLEVRELALTDPTDGHHFFAGGKIGFKIERNQHTLIVGKPGSGKSELLQALAGLWKSGHGWIIRPTLDRIAFVSPNPYLTPSSLRALFTPDNGSPPGDRELLAALDTVGLDELAGRVGGLDEERDWNARLPLNERQALALARLLILKPTFAVLNEATGNFDGDTRQAYYDQLAGYGVTIVTLSMRKILPDFHHQFIQIPGGSVTLAGPAAA